MLISGVFSTNEHLPYVTFNEQSGHYSLHAGQPYKKDDVISTFGAGATHFQATYLTIQTGDDCHISLAPSFLQYVNHSCVPNSFFDTGTMKFIALRTIEKGDELCFFYPSTEWQMAQAFTCHCGALNCLKEIQGAAFLSNDVVTNYRLSGYIISKLKARND